MQGSRVLLGLTLLLATLIKVGQILKLKYVEGDHINTHWFVYSLPCPGCSSDLWSINNIKVIWKTPKVRQGQETWLSHTGPGLSSRNVGGKGPSALNTKVSATDVIMCRSPRSISLPELSIVLEALRGLSFALQGLSSLLLTATSVIGLVIHFSQGEADGLPGLLGGSLPSLLNTGLPDLPQQLPGLLGGSLPSLLNSGLPDLPQQLPGAFWAWLFFFGILSHI